MWYDLFILAVLVFFTINGAARGVVWQVAGIAGILLCFAFADAISAAFGPYVQLAPPLNHWVVLFAAYLIFSFLCFGMAKMLNDWIEKAEMKEYNRHLGAAFGLLKGVILSLIITFLVVTVSADAREALKQSKSGYYAAHIMNRLHPVMPEKLHDALADYIHLLDDESMGLPPTDHDHNHDGTTPLGTGNSALGDSTSNPFDISNPFNTNNGAAPTSLGQPGTVPTNNGQAVTLDSFFKDVRGRLSLQAKSIVQDAFKNQMNSQSPATQQQLKQLQQIIEQTPSRDLASLQKEIINAGTGHLDQFIAAKLGTAVPAQPATPPGQFPSSIPTNPPATQPTTNPWSNFGNVSTPTLPQNNATFDQAIEQFSKSLSSVPAVQQNYTMQVKQQLAGIPEQLLVPVLNDWKADLFGQADPDPTTNKNSPVEARAWQAAQRAGVTFNQFSPEWQRRLQAVLAGGNTSRNPL